jgi:thiol:disulfide interchange protein DsbA
MKIRKLLIFIPFLFSSLIFADFRQGVDYRLVSNPLPVKRDGIVEVTEVFWYECAACYNFYPAINDWYLNQDNSVKFSKMPVTWHETARNQAALFYTIEALGLGSNVQSSVFLQIHKERKMLRSPKQITDFLSKFGVEKNKAKQYLDSFTIKQRVERANKTIKQLQVQSTPTVIVDGKYIISPKRSFEEYFKVLDYVIELQKPNS